MARKLLLWSGWCDGVLMDKHTDGSSKSCGYYYQRLSLLRRSGDLTLPKCS